MEYKEIRLREQFDSAAMEVEQQSAIFKGVSIHVNGYTQPSFLVSEIVFERKSLEYLCVALSCFV